MIGAPTCEVEPIAIGSALLPHDILPGVPLLEGVGTATLDLEGTVTEIRPVLTHRDRDDNRIRHAGIYALVDWCFGSDLQWLQRVDADFELYSHDHGWYFPPSGPDWNEAELTTNVTIAVQVTDSPVGLDTPEVERLADLLSSPCRDQLAAILNDVPVSMPVTNTELECLGWFLEERAPQVARRLRTLLGGNP
jgi:hypothetical protein